MQFLPEVTQNVDDVKSALLSAVTAWTPTDDVDSPNDSPSESLRDSHRTAE
jgi:hypothetical protein